MLVNKKHESGPGILHTYTGKEIDVRHPRLKDIDIVDIAHSLSMQCRYGGRCNKFYSVAEHCWLMSIYDFLPGRPIAKLLHDATEAYVGDVVRGIKILLPEYQTIEKEFERLIGKKFGIFIEEFNATKEADNIILMTEVKENMCESCYDYLQRLKERPDIRIKFQFLSPEKAEQIYLSRFEELIRD